MHLTTHYLGLTLRNPLVASASPLSVSLDRVTALADSGVGAIVLYSLFEEEVVARSCVTSRSSRRTRTPSVRPCRTSRQAGRATEPSAARYLRLIERASGAVDVPVIGSLNGSTEGGWTRLARSMEDAGASAIELNIYFVPGDPHTPAGSSRTGTSRS